MSSSGIRYARRPEFASLNPDRVLRHGTPVVPRKHSAGVLALDRVRTGEVRDLLHPLHAQPLLGGCQVGNPGRPYQGVSAVGGRVPTQ